MAEKKATTGRQVLIMQDCVPEERLAYFKDMLDRVESMLMDWCVEMRYMVCTHMHLWTMAGHKVKRDEHQRNIRKSGNYTAKAEAVNVLQDVEQIYRKGRRFRRCKMKAA